MSYQIDVKDNVLVFTTDSFEAEGKSVLHSGIYSRELSSSLAAGGVLMLFGFFFALRGRITIVHVVAGAAVFAVLFLFFRGAVFREPALVALFDRNHDMIDVEVKKAVLWRRQRHIMSGLKEIRLDHTTVEPQNPDGIKVVEKIALQHGMVIPGFGKTEEIYAVVLGLAAGPLTIFSTKKREDAEKVVAEIGKFLSIKVSEKNFDTLTLS